MIRSITDIRYVTLQDACNKHIPSRPHLNTIKRWCDRGYNGIVLQSCKHGNRRMTSIEWIDEFFAKTAGTQAATSQQSVSHQEAERALDAMGVN